MDRPRYRRFRNKRSKAVINVDEKDIKELVELYDVLKVPYNCSTITNSGIEYVKYGVHEINDLREFKFIFNHDLTKDLKDFFITYYGCLAIYLDDSELDEDWQKEYMINKLEDEFHMCLKKAATTSQFITKTVYKELVLSDFNTKSTWELLEDDKLMIV